MNGEFEELKREIITEVEGTIGEYKATGDKRLLYELLDFINWLSDYIDSTLKILKAEGLPIVEEKLPTPTVTTKPITIRIPKIKVKIPKRAEVIEEVTKETKETETEETEELEVETEEYR